MPVVILDNDFRDPDIDRYLERFEAHDPAVGILGDADTRREAEGLNEVATRLHAEYPSKELVVVPKCREALDVLDEELVLGYSMGYSDTLAGDFSEVVDWRGRRVHLLGASPPKQYAVIQDLTQPTLAGDAPADVVGLDWNGLQKTAYMGEYWSRDGWQPADHLSIRETVREGLEEVKRFWQEKGVWPETEPIELYGEAVEEPDELIFVDDGGDPIASREALEEAYVEGYPGYGTLAFRNESRKKFVEWREGLLPV